MDIAKKSYASGLNNTHLFPGMTLSNTPTLLTDIRYGVQDSKINIESGCVGVQYIEENTIRTWGLNRNGALGIGVESSSYKSETPRVVSGYQGVAKKILTSHDGSVFVLNNDGDLYNWGGYYSSKTARILRSSVDDVFCNRSHARSSIIILEGTTKKVYGYGSRENIFGIDSTAISLDFVELPYLSSRYDSIKDIVIGKKHTFVLYVDGTVDYCGDSTRYETGANTVYTQKTFTPHPYLQNIKSIFTNNDVSFAISNDDKVYVWGDDQTGYGSGIKGGTEGSITQPTEIPELRNKGIKSITMGIDTQSFVACSSDKSMYVWGLNANGELGLGHNNPVPSPIKNSFFDNKSVKPQSDPNGSFYFETEVSVSVEMININYPEIEFRVRDNVLRQIDRLELKINGAVLYHTSNSDIIFNEQKVRYTIEDNSLVTGSNILEIVLCRGTEGVKKKILDITKAVTPIQPKDGMQLTIGDTKYSILRVTSDNTGKSILYLDKAIPAGSPNIVKIPLDVFTPSVTYSYNGEQKTADLNFVTSRTLGDGKIESKYELADIVFDKCALQITSNLTSSSGDDVSAKLTNPMIAFQYLAEKV